jgi:hypothetical protein
MDCVVYGVGSTYVHEVDETLRRLQYHVHGYVSNLADGYEPDLAPLVRSGDMPPSWTHLPVLLPLVTPGYRQALEHEVLALGFTTLATVIDPTSVLASTVAVDAGVLVNAGCVVGANASLKRLVLLNRSVSVGHHVTVQDYATLGPGCTLCAFVTVGQGAFVGAGSVINPHISVGANAVIGSGAVVTRDVPANTVVVGNPARVVREGNPGYNGVSVAMEVAR